ncbi:AfsR/SARP family transcriptional regulator [Sphaerisporangium corydalis]|uniref:BTAD domain-containing putative transcriptional regulator n=1 Tax=Sphaerisporangium corydalis TaxID=1441875 RepID=A0ABV9EL28_9ACTN|nr:BTAD domain-containing putative transcriptional regulator [Sphaerisporangium corydalis]
MRVAILGPLRVERASGDTAELAGARLRALLVRLALDPGAVVTAERLIDDLWVPGEPANPLAALQSLVARLRRELGGRDAVVSHPAGYRLGAPPDAVDAWAFERDARLGAAALRAGDPARAGQVLREALALWRGPALADATGFAFAAAPAARLEEMRLAALEARIDADLACSVPGLAAELEELVAAHPAREPFQARLMRALTAGGRRADALDLYERVRATLADRLGVDPGPELRSAHLAALHSTSPTPTAPLPPKPPAETGAGETAGPRTHPATGPEGPRAEPGARPEAEARTEPRAGTRTAAKAESAAGVTAGAESAARAESAAAGVAAGAESAAGTESVAGAGVRGNLPAPLTSFVGRGRDLARVDALLDASRLVTLTGPGGAGKTRLAMEAARRRRAPDGVWLIELAHVTRPSGVAEAVRAVLGSTGLLAELGGPQYAGTAERLYASLAGREALLVLDNCEHVIDAVAGLAQRMLAVAPGLRMLTTSREPLGVTGESLHPVPALEVPGENATPQAALTFPAVVLLADRAAAVSPGFAVDAGTVADVVRLCRELDGIPLAIELAAARLRSLTPAQLAGMIGDRFTALGRGNRTTEHRHRTLRAVIDWSWDLLGPEDRVALRRLSVFAGGSFSGGVTSEAAARVCGADLETLTSLVDRSLLIATTTQPITAPPTGGVRYRLLETVRHYAAEKLAESGERDALRVAHAEWILDLTEGVEPLLRGRDQARVLSLLDAHQGDLDAALSFAITGGLVDTALRLFAARLWSWVMRGRRREAAEWAAAVLRSAGETPPPGLEAEHAMCLLLATPPTPADQTLPALPDPAPPTPSDQIPPAPADRTPPVLPDLTPPTPADRTPAALPLWMGARQAEALGRLEDLPRAATLGSWAIMGGYFGGAEDLRRRAGAMAERFGGHPDAWTRATASLVQGIVRFEMTPGGASGAEAPLRSALEVYSREGERWGMSFALYWLSLLMENRGELPRALALLEESAARAAEIGATDGLPGPSMLPVRLGQLRARTGDLAGAAAELDRARLAAARAGDLVASARTWHALGELSRREGDLAEARARLRRALDLLARVRRVPPAPSVRPSVPVPVHVPSPPPAPASDASASLTPSSDARPPLASVSDARPSPASEESGEMGSVPDGSESGVVLGAVGGVPAGVGAASVLGASPQFVAFVHVEMARVETLAGNPGAAVEPLRYALELGAVSEDDTAHATVLEGVAEWCLYVGDAERAVVALGAARCLRGIEESGDPEVGALLGRCAEELGEECFTEAWRHGTALRHPSSSALLPAPS